jgi:uncharacterized protein YjiK
MTSYIARNTRKTVTVALAPMSFWFQKCVGSALLLLSLCCAMATVANGQDKNGITLRFLDRRSIVARSEGLREPSGLSIADGGKHFWTVSDNASRIFRIGPEGKLDRTGTIKIELSGPEGIAEDSLRQRLLIVSENESEIVEVNLHKGTARRFTLRQITGYVKNGLLFSRWGINNGLEGITVDPTDGAVFVLKEKSPRLLIELSPDLSLIRSVLPLAAELGFADDRVSDDDLDVSGIAYDPRRRAFWIVSDTARRLFLFEPRMKSAISWPLTIGKGIRRLPNPEGIALSEDGRVIFVVSDDHGDSALSSYSIDERLGAVVGPCSFSFEGC